MEEEKKFKCDWEGCKSAFKQLSHLARHRVSHSNIRSFKCDICGFAFLRAEALKRHKEIVHDPYRPASFTCHICSKSFKLKQLLVRHLKSLLHNQDNRIQCEFCSKRLKDEESVRQHNIKFHSSKRFVCTICQKPFAFYFRLIAHMMEHEGIIAQQKDKIERTLRDECPICHVVILKRTMKGHIMACHQNIRPFKCPICQDEFARNCTLRNHIFRVHDKSQPLEFEEDQV